MRRFYQQTMPSFHKLERISKHKGYRKLLWLKQRYVLSIAARQLWQDVYNYHKYRGTAKRAEKKRYIFLLFQALFGPTSIGWRLKPEILAQGGLNVNERHHGYYWSLVHTHQLQGRWHLIWPFFVSVQGQRSKSAFLHKMADSSLSYANKHCFT